jgi:hypothetical protein
MRTPFAARNSESMASTLASPAFLVVLVLLFGATVYLWRQRYIRRRAAYVVMTILGVTIAVVGLMMYRAQM